MCCCVVVRKQCKALQLFLKLSEAELNESNCVKFFQVLNDFFKEEQLPTATAVVAKNVVTYYKSQECIFSHEHKFLIQNWFLLYSVREDLRCDDSFQFSKACQYVSELFDCEEMFPVMKTVDYTDETQESNSRHVQGSVDTPGDALKKARVSATLSCLTTALPLYSRCMWAKQPLDQLFKIVALRRLQVDDDQREQVDELTTKITLARRKGISGKPAQTVRSYNSTAHPLKTKNVGLMR